MVFTKRQVYLLLPLSILLSLLLTLVPITLLSLLIEEESIKIWIQVAAILTYPLSVLIVLKMWKNKIRISWLRSSRNKVKFFIGGIAIGLSIFLIASSIGYVLSYLSLHHNMSSNIQWGSTLLFVAIIALKCLAVSFSEELLFRGILLKNLCQHIHTPAALVYSSFLFVLVHFTIDPASILYFFSSGLLFGFLYLVSKSIFLPVGLHFSINIIYYSTHTTTIGSLLDISPIFTSEIAEMSYGLFLHETTADSLNSIIYSLIMMSVVAFFIVFKATSRHRASRETKKIESVSVIHPSASTI